MSYFNIHNHTTYSNIRLLDCINKPKDLIDRAIEIGLSGIAITEHESLGSSIEVNQIAKEYRDKYPNFTIALGNEIYLVNERKNGQKYHHFLLIAKDRLGYRGLTELSSIAWYNMYVDRKMERVPVLKEELKSIMPKYKGHIIATSACMGGELSTKALGYLRAKQAGDYKLAQEEYQAIVDFIAFCQDIFGDDFYIECAPSSRKDQIDVNQTLRGIANFYNIKMVVGTDSHYLKKEDRFIHEAYLTSKEGEREVAEFYEFARLMDENECRELLSLSFENNFINEIFENTQDIQKQIEFYSLEKPQKVVEVDVKDYPKSLSWFGDNNSLRDELDSRWPILKSLFLSDNIQERYWVNQCFEGLIEKDIGLNEVYLDRLEEEADIKRVIGEKLNTCMFAYPNTLQHYINLFWECGSTVGAGRGSACAGLNHYLLGISQLDPIQWGLPYWRYLNKERAELGEQTSLYCRVVKKECELRSKVSIIIIG